MSESIVVTYQTELRAFFGVLTRQGVTRLGDVLSNHVRAYCEMPDKNGALPAASTKPKRRSAVSSFFETCRVLGLVDQNPTMGVVFPPRPSRYVGAFDDVAIQQLRNVSCSVLGDTRTPSMFALVLCGAAPKELVNVTVADVDLAQGRVWLHDGGYRCRDRWVSFLDDWCATAIRNRVNEMRATYGAEADAVWLVYKPHPSKPTPTRQDSAGSSVMSRLLDKARVHNPGKNRTESIREWVAATVFEETGSLEEVALRLGMASLDAAAHLVGYDWLEVSGHDFTPPAHRLAEAGGPS